MSRIGIDARMLGKGHGLGRYVEQLLKGIVQYGGEHQYVVFVLSEFQISDLGFQIDTGNAQQQFGNQKFSPSGVILSRDRAQIENLKFVVADIPWYTMEEQIKFSAIIKKQNIDLMHFPHWNIPLLYNDPFVVTIHDLTMYHYTRAEATTHGPVVYWAKDMAHRAVVRHAVSMSKHIITTSEFTKHDVHETLGVPLEKMTTIYQAPVEKKQNTKIQDTNKSQIVKPYVLYVGAAYPHKNIDGLLRAWEVFCEKYGNDYQLVLSGKSSPFYQKVLEAYSENKTVVFTGFVNDEDLAVLYANARTFVLPSLYEGFGLPPLEAMQYGVPIVSSNRSCLPEVLGEGAYYADPEDAGQLADALFQVCDNEEVRYALKQQGREELKRYSSESFTQQTLSLYTKWSQ